jgi:hypothetical protein
MRLVRVIAEHFPKREDVLRQISLFDEVVRPHLLHQERFFNYVPAMPQEDEESLQNLRGKRHSPAVAQEHPVVCIERKTSKPEYACLILHGN